MPTYIIHDDTGRILDPCRTCSVDQLDGQLSDGLHAIERPAGLEVDPARHWVDGDLVVDRALVDDLEALAAVARSQRDARLAACDWVVTRAVESSAQVPEVWRDYRSALRDVTLQAGFPKSVTWPDLPA